MSGYEDILLKMKDKSDEFSTFLTDLNNLNNDVKTRTGSLLKKIDDLKGKNQKLCTVCYTRVPTHALQPCGHIYCENCAQRGLNRNKCFTCRQPIQELFRIFI